MLAAFRKGLSEDGLVEGKNVVIEFRWARGDYDRLPEFASELVGKRVAVIVAAGGESSGLAAKAATSTIPIVFGGSSDPMKAGLVASLNRPEGNTTGIYNLVNDLPAKRLGLFHELFPNAALFGVLFNSNYPPAVRELQGFAETARTIGQSLVVLNASTDAELDAAFGALTQQRVTAMLTTADPFFDTRRDKIIAFAAQQKLPAMYHFREYVVDGGLMSYGTSLTEAYREAGVYAAKIINGAKPSDLPVLQSTKFELVINLKTAKTLGLTIPASFLSLADELID